MPDFHFERECRTPYSECFSIFGEGQPLGRLDLHFTQSTVHATLSVQENLTQENIQELVDMIEDELVDAIGICRDEFLVHVYQGRDLGVFSTNGFTEESDVDL